MKGELARLAALAEACDAAYVQSARQELASTPLDLSGKTLAIAIGAAYPALRSIVLRRPALYATLVREGFRAPRRRLEMQRHLTQACQTEGDVRRGLRRGSEIERLRIALRELDPRVSVQETAREWSDLAEAQIEIAFAEARQHVEERFGEILAPSTDPDVDPRRTTYRRNALVVLGLGKLGGRELNAGSDVDLIVLYESDEGRVSKQALDDRRVDAAALTPLEGFSRVVQRAVATLELPDEDGFLARVDLRLRPSGAAGPIASSIGATIAYYEDHGRAWERAALLRARPIAGDLAIGERALRELSPFIYRRSVDPTIAIELREMIRRSRHELSIDPVSDLKLGPGGIREAEFFVQALQLVWGGRDGHVRSTSTIEGLRRLRVRGYVTDREAREIEAAYLLLRQAEHRVQIASGVQTHQIPASLVERDRLARSTGARGSVEWMASIDRARTRVSARFSTLTPSTPSLSNEPADRQVDAILSRLSNEGDRLALDLPPVSSFGAASPVSMAQRPGAVAIGGAEPAPLASAELFVSLQALARRTDGPLGARTIERYPHFCATFVRALLDAADPELAAGSMRAFFGRLAPPSVESYVRVLSDDERALRRMIGLCGASAYLGGSVIGHPELADRLLFGAHGSAIDEARGRALLDEELAGLREPSRDDQGANADRYEDAEAFAGALRRAKGALELEAGIAELAGEISLGAAARALTGMADATLDACARWALDEAVRRRGGDPKLNRLEGFAIAALGRLGGRELGFGSDLDVVFIYDATAIARAGLDTLIDVGDAADLYGRVAARVIRLIGTPHADGPGYALDARLRPSGEQGHLVVSADAFATYHAGDGQGVGRRAGDWERQSLLRLRGCAGDRALCARVESIAAVAAYEREPVAASELLRLRMRLETEIGRERAGRRDVKLGRGGVADVDFAVQLLQMRHGGDAPSVRTTETLAALDALEAIGAISTGNATTLREGHRFLRRLEHRIRIVHGGGVTLLDEDAPGIVTLARAMGVVAGQGATASERLVRAYREVTEEVRAAFLAVVEGDGGVA